MRPAGEGPFVGRRDEIAALEQAWADVVRGHPRLVLVSGDAGIGKTALADHLLDRRTDARVLRGGCFGLVSAELPYGPVVQALRPLTDADGSALGADTATLCAALGGSVTAVGEATSWAQSRLFETTLRLLGTLSRERPLVLALEDVHWADRATLDLLLFLVGNIVSERILFLLTARCDEPDAPPWLTEGLQRLTSGRAAEVLELSPLDAGDAARLATALGAEDADVAALAERAGGNPLFLGELARSRTPEGLPRRLRDLLLHRVRHVSNDARRVLDLLSASTAPLNGRLLVRALGNDVADPRAAVAEAFDAHLVEATGDLLRPSHALLGEAVYEALPPTGRAWLHEQLAEAFDGDPTLGDAAFALAAYHWERAGRAERVPVPLARAAETAGRCFAFADAARAWQRLLVLDRQFPGAFEAAGLDRAQVLLEAASALRWSAGPEEGVEFLREAVRLLQQEPVRAALAAEQLARLCVDLGRMDDAVSAAERAEELASGAPDTVRARIISTHAAVLMVRGEYEASRQRCLAALRLTPAGKPSWERSHLCAVLGVDLINQGDVDGATAALADAAAASDGLEDPEATLRRYVNHVYVLETAGRYDDAVRLADEGLVHAGENDLYVVGGPQLLANKASAQIAMGDLPGAQATLRHALSRPGRSPLFYARLRQAEVEVEMGRTSEAEAHLAGIERDLAGLAVESVVQTQHRLVRSLLALARFRPQDALAEALEELDRSQGGTEPVVGLRLLSVGLRALARNAVGKAASVDVAAVAADLVKAAGALRDQAPLPPCQALHDLCLAEYRELLGDVDPGAWHALGERLQAAGPDLLTPYVLYREAAARLAKEGRRAAEQPLRRAWQLLGDVPLRRDVAALAATCRIDLQPGRESAEKATSTPAVPFGLTARENEVLREMCRGATNRQIARQLGMSERTAGVHVSHILAKLSARNRAEAIAVAHRSGAVRADGTYPTP